MSATYCTLQQFFRLGLPAASMRTLGFDTTPVLKTGTGSGTVASSGAYDVGGAYATQVQVLLTVVGGGAPGTATVTVSLDGGAHSTGPLTVPAGGVLPLGPAPTAAPQSVIGATGLNAVFSGTFTPGDTYAWTVTSNLQGALDAACDRVDGRLRRRYSLPLLTWDLEITQLVASLASESVLTNRGWNPENLADRSVIDRAKRANADLDQIESGFRSPNVTTSDDPTADDPVIVTNPRRGWRS